MSERHLEVAVMNLDAARTRIAELEGFIAHIPNAVTYAVATLDPALRQEEGEKLDWGSVHRGRAFSSIRQLSWLEKRAGELLPEDEGA